MKLKVSVNFDFGKLSSDFGNIVKEYTSSYVKSSAKASRDNIDNGGFEPLEDSTKNIREWSGHPKSPPLKASGYLYKNIQQKGNALTMPEYGKMQNDGYITSPKSLIPNKEVPARPFISTTAKNKEVLDKELKKSLNKSLRSKKVVVSLS